MTEEQKKARKLSAESGKIRWIKDHCLRTKDGDDDYVFISYKSDDYEKVLDDIIYNTCQKYGLRVYFDTAFDDDSDSWITQYYKNMCDPKCKGFIAFLDDAYYSSYACLLEMMSRKTAEAGGDYKPDSLFFLPVNIGSISDIVDNSNTGLGTRRYANGKINSHAEEELKRFNEIFSEVADDDEFMRKRVYKRENDYQLYEEATAQSPEYGEMYLSITQCRRLMERVIPKKNDNDGGNKSFVDAIHDKLVGARITTVFGKVAPVDKNTKDSRTKIGKLASEGIRRCLEEGKVTDEEILLMQQDDYSKMVFKLSFKVLVRQDSDYYAKYKERYYTDSISVRGVEYKLCSQWYEKARPYVQKWIDDHSK